MTSQASAITSRSKTAVRVRSTSRASPAGAMDVRRQQPRSRFRLQVASNESPISLGQNASMVILHAVKGVGARECGSNLFLKES
jgi:hypothetical protein